MKRYSSLILAGLLLVLSLGSIGVAQTGPDGVGVEHLISHTRGDGYDSYLFEKDGKSYILEYDHASDTAWWTVLEYVEGSGGGIGGPVLDESIDLLVLLAKLNGGEMENPARTPFDQWMQHSELGIAPLHNPVVATPVDGFEGSQRGGLGMPGMGIQETLRRWANGSGGKGDNGSDSPGPHDGPDNYWDEALPGPADLVNPVMNTVPYLSGFATVARRAFE